MVICLPHNNGIVCVCVCVADGEGLPPSDEGQESRTHRDNRQCPRPLQHRLCRGDPVREKCHCTTQHLTALLCQLLVFVLFHTVLCLSQQMKYEMQTKTQQTELV